MVSIVVPVYNCMGSLRRCVDSLVSQTYKDVEIILVDDGSKDGSGAVCDEYADRFECVKVIHKANGGVSSARNTGIQNASGEYLQFVDSDDYTAPDMTEQMVRALEENQTELVICGCVHVKEGREEARVLTECGSLGKEEIYRKSPNIIRDFLLNSPWNKLYVKEKVKGFFPEGISFGEDLMFNLAYLSDIERITYLGSSPYYYIEAEDSLSHKYHDSTIGAAAENHKAYLEFARKNKWEKEAFQEIHHRFINILVYGMYDMWYLSGYPSGKKKAILSRWIEEAQTQEAAEGTLVETRFQRKAVDCIRQKNVSGLIRLYRMKRLMYAMKRR